MKKTEDKNTRYYIDIDLKNQKVVSLGFGQRQLLINQELPSRHFHRVYISKGQFYKLEKKQLEWNG